MNMYGIGICVGPLKERGQSKGSAKGALLFAWEYPGFNLSVNYNLLNIKIQSNMCVQ